MFINLKAKHEKCIWIGSILSTYKCIIMYWIVSMYIVKDNT